jgi:hypothetical protein
LSLVELAHIVFQFVRCSAPQGVGQATETLSETRVHSVSHLLGYCS